jgi:hypothetical protein
VFAYFVFKKISSLWTEQCNINSENNLFARLSAKMVKMKCGEVENWSSPVHFMCSEIRAFHFYYNFNLFFKKWMVVMYTGPLPMRTSREGIRSRGSQVKISTIYLWFGFWLAWFYSYVETWFVFSHVKIWQLVSLQNVWLIH